MYDVLAFAMFAVCGSGSLTTIHLKSIFFSFLLSKRNYKTTVFCYFVDFIMQNTKNFTQFFFFFLFYLKIKNERNEKLNHHKDQNNTIIINNTNNKHNFFFWIIICGHHFGSQIEYKIYFTILTFRNIFVKIVRLRFSSSEKYNIRKYPKPKLVEKHVTYPFRKYWIRTLFLFEIWTRTDDCCRTTFPFWWPTCSQSVSQS